MVSIKRQYLILLDFSGSMSRQSVANDNRSQSRWNQSQELIAAIINKTIKLDPDGVELVLFGTSLVKYDNVTMGNVQQIFDKSPNMGGTDLLQALEHSNKVFDRLIDESDDNRLTVLILTDGEPSNGSFKDFKNFFQKMANKIVHDSQLAYSFFQVGDDKDSTSFLKKLDDLDVPTDVKFDIVDTVKPSDFDRGLTIEAFLAKAIED
jgi:uncharacterized protein YegL